jgi:hypothetical protein
LLGRATPHGFGAPSAWVAVPRAPARPRAVGRGAVACCHRGGAGLHIGQRQRGRDLDGPLGQQLYIRHITCDEGQDDKRLLAEQVATYVAKYATKS